MESQFENEEFDEEFIMNNEMLKPKAIPYVCGYIPPLSNPAFINNRDKAEVSDTTKDYLDVNIKVEDFYMKKRKFNSDSLSSQIIQCNTCKKNCLVHSICLKCQTTYCIKCSNKNNNLFCITNSCSIR